MEIDKDHLHHAYILVGEWKDAPEHILLSLDMQKENNPDLFVYEVLGIDEARQIKTRAQTSAFGARKIFIMNAVEATVPAQNALLKTLEEPVPDTHFFLVVPFVDLILPTLRSRMQIISLDHTVGNTTAKKFLEMTMDKRIAFASKFSDSEDFIGPFLDSLLRELKNLNASQDVIKKIFTVRRMANDQVAQPRLILEHVSLILG